MPQYIILTLKRQDKLECSKLPTCRKICKVHSQTFNKINFFYPDKFFSKFHLNKRIKNVSVKPIKTAVNC